MSPAAIPRIKGVLRSVRADEAAAVALSCLALPGASSSQCNFDIAFAPQALVTRVPPRADWPPAARDPLP